MALASELVYLNLWPWICFSLCLPFKLIFSEQVLYILCLTTSTVYACELSDFLTNLIFNKLLQCFQFPNNNLCIPNKAECREEYFWYVVLLHSCCFKMILTGGKISINHNFISIEMEDTILFCFFCRFLPVSCSLP